MWIVKDKPHHDMAPRLFHGFFSLPIFFSASITVHLGVNVILSVIYGLMVVEFVFGNRVRLARLCSHDL